jgi:hypothetical protein
MVILEPRLRSQAKSESSLIIKHVDLKLLEKQRGALARLLRRARSMGGTTAKWSRESNDLLLCDGILSMLDHWSDLRYFEKHKKYREKG